MESKELMIGNWVKRPRSLDDRIIIPSIVDKVSGIGTLGSIEFYRDPTVIGFDCPAKYLVGIELTPEILEMAGFVKNDGALGAALGHTLILESREGTYKNIAVVYNSDKNYPQYYVFMREGSTTDIGDNNIVTISCDLQYLHQLQNLFFALTGIHLKIELR